MNKKKLFSFVFVALNIGSFIEYGRWWNSEIEDGRHYVLISAEWCEPCKRLKNELKSAALANGMDVIVLDVDRHPDPSKKMNPSGIIPCLLEYTKAGDRWTVRKYSGSELPKFLKGE